MGDITKIEWCDHTFNPWEGCVKVSPECDHCYAAARDHRIHHDDHWGKDSLRLYHTDAYWRQPARWNKEAVKDDQRRRVFCGSLCDVMEDRPDLEKPRERLYTIIENTSHLDWLLLTKRPQNFRRFLPADWLIKSGLRGTGSLNWMEMWIPVHPVPPNVWLMTTCGCHDSEWRIRELMQTPAYVYGLSCEPLLDKVVLPQRFLDLGSKAWVIVGGESGANARPMEIGLAFHLRAQCKEAGVPFFMKQLGGTKDKRGHMNDFPPILQVREFPIPRFKN